MRVIGLTMIVLGALGIGVSLVDWRTTGWSGTNDQSAAARPTDQEPTGPMADAAGQVKTSDGRATPPVGEPDDARPADGYLPANREAAKVVASEPSSPASVRVFERENGNGGSGPTLWADIAAASEVVSEDDAYANFQVTLSEPAERSVVIIFSTVDLSASENEDYESQRGTVTFKPGVVSAEIQTPLLDDDIKEDDEQFAIILNGAPGIVNFKTRRVTTTIQDND